MGQKQVKARLSIEVEYDDDLPETGDLREAVEHLNELGRVTKAEFTVEARTVVNLLR